MFTRVSVDIRKLRDYCLNPHHPVGKHKARVFLSQLDLRREDAEWLKEMITVKMKEAEIEWAHEDEYGKRFSADLKLDKNGNSALVRTVWIIKSDSEIPELVTCYIMT
jgi:hypothetical protein